ncbi:Chromosome partition protein Smc [Neolewinella maritima]|uniref:Chromosome partition protein Smc n=1 Tax=Neolewinella maritima TaxID=1383882 RepID=A0ABM9AXM1_9BACT|nr:AAA family ATPase [Neolewinella maritima]CAH0999412.1 Chromosome partition protein Smc [Neolewinella maritima]
MKILRIGILNLNSLRGEHVIDFTQAPLADHPLYAIVGPTGAGKTTILDAITLALYGQTERTKTLTDAKKEVATVMTHGTAQCHAELEYEVGTGRYRSVWRRRRAHSKAHKDLQGSSREISRWNTDTGTYDILQTKKRHVERLTEEVTGLTYERFVRSVMLTQGDFDRFLKSKPGEKAEILEQITGTEVYYQLSQGAYRRHKLARDHFERATAALEHILPLRAEERAILEASLSERAEVVAALQERLRVLTTQLTRHDQAARLADQQEATATNLAACEQVWQQLATQRQQLKVCDKLLPLRPDLQEEERLTAALVHVATRSAVNQEEVKASASAQEQINEQKQALDQQLLRFTQQSPQREQCLADAEQLETALKLLAQQQQVATLDLTRHRRTRTTTLDELQRLKREILALEEQLGGLSAEAVAEETDTLEGTLPRLEQELNELTGQLTYLTVAHSIAEETQVYDKLAQEVRVATGSVDHLLQELKSAELEVDLAQSRVQVARLHASLDEHRQRLQDGDPCPLCGATHHPYSDGVVLDQQISSLEQAVFHRGNDFMAVEQQVAAATDQRNSLSSALNASSRVLEERRAQLTQLGSPPAATVEELQARKRAQQQALQTGRERLDKLRRLRPLVPQLQIKRAELAAKTRALEEAEQGIGQVEITLSKIQTEIKQQEDRLTELLHPHPSSSSYRQHYLRQGAEVQQRLTDHQRELQLGATQLATLKERQQSIEAQRTSLSQELLVVSERLAEALLSLNLTREEARRHLLGPTELADLRLHLQAAEQECTTNRALAERVAAEYREAAAALVGLPERSTLRAEQAQVEEELARVQRDIGSLEQQQREDEQRIEAVAHQRIELAALEKERDRWARMNELIGSADGKKFRSFAQSITLQRLVSIGNRHLETINPRYRMCYAPPAPGAKETLDLEIIDNYMNDNRRTMETLSGGETFLISLALALGLSDLARGKQLIQSLFIDEGFGTLDGKTLDQAMVTLEQLQAQGKTIGIISHVQQLRERIHCQIQLEPLGDGFSRVQLTS